MRRLITLALAMLLLTGATALAQPVPCGYVQTPDGPLPWFVEDGDGNPRPCPPDPGTAPTQPPAPPTPAPDYPARSILIPINP